MVCYHIPFNIARLFEANFRNSESNPSSDSPNVFFNIFPGQHYLMPAADALQSKVSPYSQYFPLKAPARMLFLQFNNIAYLNIHKIIFFPKVLIKIRAKINPISQRYALKLCQFSKYFSYFFFNNKGILSLPDSYLTFIDDNKIFSPEVINK